VNDYDLILIHPWVRKAPMYLNIVRHLSPEYRIGIFLTNPPKVNKFYELEKQFIELGTSYGADVFSEGQYSCRLALVSITGYGPDKCKIIKEAVRATKYVGILMAGQPLHESGQMEIVRAINIRTILAEDISLSKKQSPETFGNSEYEFLEVGLPYGRYPAFNPDEVAPIDYIIAPPSRLSFSSPEQKVIYLRNTLRLLKRLSPDSRVYLKVHNAQENATAREFSSPYPGWNKVVHGLPIWILDKLQRILGGISFIFRLSKLHVLRHQIMFGELCKRVPSLSSITPYANLPIEYFVPHVGRGVITGRSGLVYGCLYEHVPVYNCDDEEVESRKKLSIDLFHHYCGVRPCRGKLEFDPSVFQSIPCSVRQSDLMEVLRMLIQKSSKNVA
jgi:hypothetical protein